MMNKDMNNYRFDELIISYDRQNLSTKLQGDDLIFTPNENMLVELHNVRAVTDLQREKKVMLELYNAENNELLCMEEQDPNSYDKEVLMHVDKDKLTNAGKYYIRILNAEPVETIQSRFDEWKGAYRYTFFILKNGEQLEHPTLRKVSLSSGLRLILDWEQQQTELDRFDVTVYNNEWELMGKAERLCFRSSRFKTSLNSPFLWTEGKYSMIVSHNKEPFLRINFDWKSGKSEAYSWGTINWLSPYYMLEKHLRKDTSWQKWQEVPGASAIRKTLATNYIRNAFNLKRMSYGLPECWEEGQHCALIMEDGYDYYIMYAFSQLVNPTFTFKEKDCSALLENRGNELNMAGIKEVMEEWDHSFLCLHHLSALVMAGGSLLLRAIEEHLQTNKNGILMLVGSEEEVLQVMEASAVIKNMMQNKNIYRMGEYSLAEQVHWVQRFLKDKSLTLSTEAGKKLIKGLEERRSWEKEELLNWMEKEVLSLFAHRIMMSGKTDKWLMKAMLTTIEASDIYFPKTDCEKDQFTVCMEDLNKMVGLDDLKNRLVALFNRSRFESKRRLLGLPVKDKGGSHMIFTGNPGTGKTTVARMVGRVFHSLGLLSKGGVIVTERSKLVGRYIGDTENNVQALLEQAKGNVLFIDEAYNLYTEKDNNRDFGNRVIESLLTTLSQKNPDLIVILAGYETEMNQMLESNPGLKGRFPYHFKFEDYDAEELMQIASGLLKDSEYILIPEAEIRLKETIKEAVSHKDAYFHNARWVEQYIQEGILTAMSERLMKQSVWTEDKTMYQTITEEDIEKAYLLMQPKTTNHPSTKKRIGFVA